MNESANLENSNDPDHHYVRAACDCGSRSMGFESPFAMWAEDESDSASVILQFKPPNGVKLIDRSDRQTVRSSVDGTNVYAVDHDVMVTECVFRPGSNGYIACQVARGM